MDEISSTGFTWATGIEDTFIPQSRSGLRALDEYELTQHYCQWQGDLQLAAQSGVHALRWGIPWYRVQPTPASWDWAWTDQVLDYLVNVLGLIPILDLMHYGTPLWLENSFMNASYAERVAEYAAAVADRYQSLVRYYTPLNEPMVNAEYCGQRGVWPPYLEGEDGYVKLLLALGRGIVKSVQALKAVQPEMRSVQVEALWRHFTKDPRLSDYIEHVNARQWLCFDLTTGRVGQEYAQLGYLQAQGVSEAEVVWFQENAVS